MFPGSQEDGMGGGLTTWAKILNGFNPQLEWFVVQFV